MYVCGGRGDSKVAVLKVFENISSCGIVQHLLCVIVCGGVGGCERERQSAGWSETIKTRK